MKSDNANNVVDANNEDSFQWPEELNIFINTEKDVPGSLIKILHKVQEHYGYIPRNVAKKLSVDLNKPLSKIYGVVTFYHLFSLTKPGKYRIAVCMGTACYLKGAADLIQAIEDILGVGLQGVTEDGLFSFEVVRCVGCCGLAPVIVINEEVYGNLTKDDLPGIIAKYRNKSE